MLPASVPVRHYNYALMTALISTFLFIANCCMLEYRLNNFYLSSLLKNSWVRIALGLDFSRIVKIKYRGRWKQDIHYSIVFTGDLRRGRGRQLK